MTGATDPGMVREHNEDDYTMDPSLGLAVLADGMGGYNAGEVASRIATTHISTRMKQKLEQNDPGKRDGIGGPPLAHRLLRETVAEANREIFETAQRQPQCAGMGTTLVVALFYDNQLTVAHIGDSRLYRLRDGQLETLTSDHSLLQEQLNAGLITPAEAKNAHYKNLVTRALGVDETVEAELNDYPVQPGDVYLLCSDGLNDMLPDEDIGDALGMLAANLPLAAQQLVQMANDAGGRDNVTAALVSVKAAFPAKRRLGWLSNR